MTTPRRVNAGSIACLWFAALLRISAQVTESPDTVAPGKLLVEMDAVTLGFDRERAGAAGNTFTAVGVAGTLVTAGLTSSVDLQAGLQVFLRQTIQEGGGRTSRSGLGDLVFRTKWTFWRDDGAGAAAAVIPFVKLPGNVRGVGRGAKEGGIIVPWAMKLTGGFQGGAMLKWDLLRNATDTGYYSRWLVSGFAEQNLTEKFAVYGEVLSTVESTGLSDWYGAIGAGLLWNFTKRLQFDYELTRGLNAAATDWTHALRLNWRW